MEMAWNFILAQVYEPWSELYNLAHNQSWNMPLSVVDVAGMFTITRCAEDMIVPLSVCV